MIKHHVNIIWLFEPLTADWTSEIEAIFRSCNKCLYKPLVENEYAQICYEGKKVKLAN
jgi:hypothetical protein